MLKIKLKKKKREINVNDYSVESLKSNDHPAIQLSRYNEKNKENCFSIYKLETYHEIKTRLRKFLDHFYPHFPLFGSHKNFKNSHKFNKRSEWAKST